MADIIHNCEFDEFGCCPSCSLDYAECQCPGPFDQFAFEQHLSDATTNKDKQDERDEKIRA